jgi:glucokinase-like ROK family protein
LPVTGVRPENEHQARLVRLLRDVGQLSRAALGEAVELSRSKLAVEIDRLIELALLEPAGLAASRGGRRSSIVGVRADIRFLAIDVGGGSMTVAVADGQLEILWRGSAPVGARHGPAAVLAKALDLICEAHSADMLPRLLGVGVALPGPVDHASGTLRSSPALPGWHLYPIRDKIAAEMGCPVAIENGVNLMALGESHAGVAKSVSDYLFLKIGASIGCAIVTGGEIYRGANGSAGNIGHMRVADSGPTCSCGNIGCLEAFVSGYALARDGVLAAESGQSPPLAARLAQAGTVTARDVADAAATGDLVAHGLIREAAHRIGEALVGMVSFVNPGLVVIGGGVASIGHSLLAEVRSIVYRRSAPQSTGNMPILLAELGDEAGLVGAVRLISDEIFAPLPT